MREIKFRAWNRITKQMYWWGIPETSDGHITTHEFLKGDVAIMQFTGLKDWDGKEIYEGDIVNYREKVITIVYDEENVGFAMRGLETWDCHFLRPKSEDYEIIGNIYENPELLK